jgi:hypothetical protein
MFLATIYFTTNPHTPLISYRLYDSRRTRTTRVLHTIDFLSGNFPQDLKFESRYYRGILDAISSFRSSLSRCSLSYLAPSWSPECCISGGLLSDFWRAVRTAADGNTGFWGPIVRKHRASGIIRCRINN